MLFANVSEDTVAFVASLDIRAEGPYKTKAFNMIMIGSKQ